jgi:hypothetical protein
MLSEMALEQNIKPGYLDPATVSRNEGLTSGALFSSRRYKWTYHLRTQGLRSKVFLAVVMA